MKKMDKGGNAKERRNFGISLIKNIQKEKRARERQMRRGGGEERK